MYRLYMDEKDDESHYPPELTEAKEVVRCGYMNPCEIQTFPIAGCETGQSKITDAYRLPCKKVIHTVGLVWHGGSKGEGRLLASCYDTELELANANRLHRIASALVYIVSRKRKQLESRYTPFSHLFGRTPKAQRLAVPTKSR